MSYGGYALPGYWLQGYALGDQFFYYEGLITSEHRDKPRFMAVVGLLAGAPREINYSIVKQVTDFDLDGAVGAQLDVIGLWVGISRRLRVPLTNVYFSWDSTPLLGWDSGVWQGPFDPSTGLASLGDDDYRRVLRIKIAANYWDGTLGGAEAIWSSIFTGGQRLVLQDNQDMSMVVGFVGPPLNAVQQALLTGGYFPLKPGGVRINYYAIPPNEGPLFAWDADGGNLAGWDSGSWSIELQPS